MGTCILCNENATINRQESSSRSIYNCPQCGVFIVSDLVEEEARKYQNELAAFFMSRKLAGHNSIVMLTYEKAQQDKHYTQLTVQQIVERYPRRFSEKMDLALLNLANLSSYAGEEVRVDHLAMAPLFYVQKSNFEALSFMIKAMAQQELVSVNYFGASFFPCGVTVSAQGWDRVSDLLAGGRPHEVALLSQPREENQISAQFYRSASKCVRESGYRVLETKTTSADGSVNLDLIAQIRCCRFVLCDLSFSGAEGYYTAGMALALGKTCILTCHANFVENLQMDTNQIHVQMWKNEAELYTLLSSAIRAFVV